MANCKKCGFMYGYYEPPGICSKCYDLNYKQKNNKTTEERKQQLKIKQAIKNSKTKNKTKPEISRTYDQWYDRGFQVQRGTHATGCNKNGISTFTRKQVKPR